jgi:hypothetical protein
VSTDRDVERIVRSWMDEGVTQLPDRVLDLVLDQIPATPQRRASWLARRTPTMNTFARFALVAAAVIVAIAVGIGLFARPSDVGPPTEPTASSTPSPASSASPSGPDNPLIGTWLAPRVTCAQQIATLHAAGFTDEQIVSTGDDPTCAKGGTAQYSLVFEDPRTNYNGVRILSQYADGLIGWGGVYRIVDGQTFQAGDNGTFFITYRYVIDGDQLTIDMIEDNMPTTSQVDLLSDQLTQTEIYETSPFTRQP